MTEPQTLPTGHDGLAAALSAAQGEFAAVPKGGTNPHFKSKFPELADAVRTAAPVLAKHGLAVTQLVDFDEISETLTTILMHETGQQVRSVMRLRPVKNDPQSLGSAITYARRYSYMAILGLAADDDDGQEASTTPAAPPTARPVKPAAATSSDEDPKQELLRLMGGDQSRFEKNWPAFARSRGIEP